MHFYDPVLAIVWDRVSPSTKELVSMRKSVAKQVHESNDLSSWLLDKFGLDLNKDEDKERLSSKSMSNVVEDPTHGLQSSRYVGLDTDITYARLKAKSNMNLQYCPSSEVSKRHREFFNHKCQLLARIVSYKQ